MIKDALLSLIEKIPAYADRKKAAEDKRLQDELYAKNAMSVLAGKRQESVPSMGVAGIERTVMPSELMANLVSKDFGKTTNSMGFGGMGGYKLSQSPTDVLGQIAMRNMGKYNSENNNEFGMGGMKYGKQVAEIQQPMNKIAVENDPVDEALKSLQKPPATKDIYWNNWKNSVSKVRRNADEFGIDRGFWNRLVAAESTFDENADHTNGGKIKTTARGLTGLTDSAINEVKRLNPSIEIGDLNDPNNILRLSGIYWRDVVKPKVTEKGIDIKPENYEMIYRHWVKPNDPMNNTDSHAANFRNKEKEFKDIYALGY